MANIGFFALSLLMIFIDGWIIASALRQRDRDGNFLAAIMGCSAAVCLFYSISICVEDYVVMSLSSSLYFVAMDGVCLSLVAYLFSFTDSWQTKIRFFLMRAFIVVAVVDSAFLLTNPFCEVALTYAYDPEALAPWHYVAMMPFQFHLGFCYVMVCVSFVILCCEWLQFRRFSAVATFWQWWALW